MELEKNVKHGQLPFLRKDIHNFYNKVYHKHAKSDAKNILEHCKLAKIEEPNFQYAFTIEEERKLEHIFWSSAHCYNWYQTYGDVVVFDTTYKINSYDMPFGVFVGVDNNGRTILFGCALLRNETTSAFCWLMKTFASLMKRAPNTILTDQDPWMTKAISNEMPFTKHAFCIWHITAKFSGWFNSVLRNKYSSWCNDFYRLYKLDDAEEFENQWSSLIANYKLGNNKHIDGLYEIKKFWVPAYLRDYFFGGMTTTSRSESINAFIKRFISSHTTSTKFINQINLVIEDIEQTQLHDTMLENYRGSCLRSMSSLEEQAHIFLTPFAFKKFQEEFGRASQYRVIQITYMEYLVQYFKDSQSRKHKIAWDGETATCGCKYFEFSGMLCRHILSVFLHKNCFQIPLKYLPLRWCRERIRNMKEMSVPKEQSYIYIEKEVLCDDNATIDFVHCPPLSKTKGRPKQNQLKGGKELAKQKKTCGFCKQVGHNISTCPEKDNVASSNGDKM